MEGTVLIHHGILGQKWGVRRYQNSDGSLTNEGKKRYNYETANEMNNMSDEELKTATSRLRAENDYLDQVNRKVSNLDKMEIDKGKQFLEKAVEKTKLVAQLSGNIAALITNIDKVNKIKNGDSDDKKDDKKDKKNDNKKSDKKDSKKDSKIDTSGITLSDVHKVINKMQPKAEKKFQKAEKRAKRQFEKNVRRKEAEARKEVRDAFNEVNKRVF